MHRTHACDENSTHSKCGAQWLSGKVHHLRSRGGWFDHRQRQCVVNVSKTLHPVQPRNRPDRSGTFLERDVKYHIERKSPNVATLFRVTKDW